MDSFRGVTAAASVWCKALGRCDLTVPGDALIPSPGPSDAFRNNLAVEKKKRVEGSA